MGKFNAKRATATIEGDDIESPVEHLKVKKGWSLVPGGTVEATGIGNECSYHFTINVRGEKVTVYLTESVLQSMLDAIDARHDQVFGEEAVGV